MPQESRKYDFYLPLRYNNGRDIEREKLDQVERELFSRFGGLTSIKRDFPLSGIWGNETTVYEDEIIILTTIDSPGNLEETEQFITDYKEMLKIRFKQEEILITGQDLTIY
ncbi:hypothetical protein H8E77_32030 [bacterium]|nr:hypothetical protein [bacterium]